MDNLPFRYRSNKYRFIQKLPLIIIISCLFLTTKTSDAQENQEDTEKQTKIEEPSLGTELISVTQGTQYLNKKLKYFKNIILHQNKTQTELKRQIASLEEKNTALEKENAALESMLSIQAVDLRKPELIKADEKNLNKVINLNLGFAYGIKGQIKEAIVEYEMALRYDPDNKDIHYNLGYLLSKDNKYIQAIEEYKKALTGSPQDREVYYNLTIIYAIYLKDSKTAQQYYQKFLTVPLTQTHLVPSRKEPIQRN